MNAKEIDGLLARPKLYQNLDGLEELGLGLACLGCALFGWMQLHTPPDAVWHTMWAFGIYMTLMIAILHFGTKAIKNRITYRRTGFVAYRPRRYWVPMVAAGAVSVVVAAGLLLVSRRNWDVSAFVPVYGLLFAVVYVRFARTAYWKWAAFWVIVAGSMAIAVLPPGLLDAFANSTGRSSMPDRAMAAFWLTIILIGAVLMISGAISFVLYLRHTQPAAQEGS